MLFWICCGRRAWGQAIDPGARWRHLVLAVARAVIGEDGVRGMRAVAVVAVGLVSMVLTVPAAAFPIYEGFPLDPGLDRAGFYGYPVFEVSGEYRYPRLYPGGSPTGGIRVFIRPVVPHRRPDFVRITNRTTGEVIVVRNTAPGGTKLGRKRWKGKFFRARAR